MIHRAFRVEEFQGRVQQVRQAMAAAGLDALSITRPQNVYFLTGQAEGRLRTFRDLVPNWGQIAPSGRIDISPAQR